jgi:hypothetical protein
MMTQRHIHEHRFVVAYGHGGRIVAAVSFNYAMRLPAYQALIEASAPFPPSLHAPDGPAATLVFPAGFPQPGQTTHSNIVSATGNRLPDSHISHSTDSRSTPVVGEGDVPR